MALGLMQNFISNEGDAWQYTLDELSQFLEHTQMRQDDPPQNGFNVENLLKNIEGEIDPPFAHEVIGPYLESASLLGTRTGELHLNLADSESEDFAPEEFSQLYQRSLYQSQRSYASGVFQTLRKQAKNLPEDIQPHADEILSHRDEVLNRFKALTTQKMDARRIRTHGDYHLGQVLYTGKDFIIIDFEGEPSKSLSERRIKRSPLRDVAGMLRSFHYAAYAALFNKNESGVLREDEYEKLENWVNYWYMWVTTVYFKAYLDTVKDSGILPQDQDHLKILLESFLLEKAVYEMGYEMNNRPTWLPIPMQGILSLINSPEA